MNKLLYTSMNIIYIYLLLATFYGDITSVCQKNGKFNAQSTNGAPKEKKLLRVIEENFLQFMGMSKKPKAGLKKKVKIPKHLWKLYLKWSDDNYSDEIKDNSDTARILSHSVAKDHVERVQNKLNFDINNIAKDEDIQKAELHLYTHNNNKKRLSSKRKNIKIYEGKEKKIPIHNENIRKNRLGYITIDVTKTVRNWLNNSVYDPSLIIDDTNNGTEISHLHLRRRRNIRKSEWHHKRPVLMLYTLKDKDKPNKIRTRRYARMKSKKEMQRLNTTHINEKKEKCRLRNFFLDFKDVAWDEWIIAPTGYNINYCHGICPKPLGPHYNTTNHAVIQNSVANINRGLVPPLCCIPTTLKDQTFLYLDDHGSLIIKNPIDMVAMGCGCH